jgi:WD40 repeat protein
MNIEEGLNIADRAVFTHAGRRLSEVEIAILKGSWERQTYEQIADEAKYAVSYVKQHVGPDLWKLLGAALGEPVSKINFRLALERWSRLQPPQNASSVVQGIVPTLATSRQDWGEAIDVSTFYGRSTELDLLTTWMSVHRCRLVAILGMGGIGKTALAVKLSQQMQAEFECTIWRSLRNAPTLETLLTELVPFISNHQETKPEIGRLIHYLRSLRCLLILDNVETILQGGKRGGLYRSGYEDYGELFQCIGETNHHSCLLITSREKPAEIASLEGQELSTRSLSLRGSTEASRALLQAKGLIGSASHQQQLCDRYSNNPLALKIVSTSIQDLFDGEISEFLDQDTQIFNGIRRLLDLQFQRLSPLEATIMYWLAIDREWTSIAELQSDIFPAVSRGNLLESLEGLSWRSLLERQSGKYSQQPVVMEYVTEQFIDRICEDIQAGSSVFLSRYPLLKALAKDYIRETQVSLILQPIIDRLLAHFGTQQNLENHLSELLSRWRSDRPESTGYAGGNILNLLCQLNIDLSNFDFSHLPVWQAYLADRHLSQTNFAHADLSKSVFTETIGVVLSLAFSPDGTLLATGDAHGEIRLWRVADGQQLLVCPGHTVWVTSVAFSSDGTMLASSGIDATIKLWDVQTGQCLKTLQGHTNLVWSVAFSADDCILASGSADGTIKLWDPETGQCLNTLSGHALWIYSIAYIPIASTVGNASGQTLASGSFDGTVKLWDTATGQCLNTLVGHTERIYSIAANDRILASCSADETIKLWDLQTGACLNTLHGHTYPILSVDLSADGKTLVSGGFDRTIKLWDIESGQCLKTLLGHTNQLWAVAFSPVSTNPAADVGQILASSGFDQTVKLWDVSTGKCLKTIQGKTNQLHGACFSPNGKTLASVGEDALVRLWDISTGQCSIALKGHTNQIRSVAFRPNGRELASGGCDRTVKVWDLDSRQCSNTFEGHQDWIHAVIYAPQQDSSQCQILASCSVDRTIKLWDVDNKQCLHTLVGHDGPVWSIAFSPDGQTLASSSEDLTLKLWDVSSGKCKQTLRGHAAPIWSIAFSPDGKTIASGSADMTMRLWDISGQCLKIFQGHTNWVYAVSYLPNTFNPQGNSSDSYTLASGSFDRTIKIWDLDSGQCSTTLSGHDAPIFSIVLSPDGHTLASSSTDETIKLWDIHMGEYLKTIRSPKPYAGMQITGVTGITPAQTATLKALGAVEELIEN